MINKLKQMLKRHYDTSLYCLRLQGELQDAKAEIELQAFWLKLSHEEVLRLKEANSNLKKEVEFVQKLEAYYREWYKDASYKLSNPRDQKGRYCGIQVVQ